MSEEELNLERLLELENSLVLPGFTPDDAWWLGSFLRDTARASNSPIAISISVGPTCLFSALLPGATGDNLGWIERKVTIAWRFQRSSYVTGQKFKSGENMFERFGLDQRKYAAAGGAVPIRVAGVGMVGVVAVSGLPQLQDHELVLAGLTALHGRLTQGS